MKFQITQLLVQPIELQVLQIQTKISIQSLVIVPFLIIACSSHYLCSMGVTSYLLSLGIGILMLPISSMLDCWVNINLASNFKQTLPIWRGLTFFDGWGKCNKVNILVISVAPPWSKKLAMLSLRTNNSKRKASKEPKTAGFVQLKIWSTKVKKYDFWGQKNLGQQKSNMKKIK